MYGHLVTEKMTRVETLEDPREGVRRAHVFLEEAFPRFVGERWGTGGSPHMQSVMINCHTKNAPQY